MAEEVALHRHKTIFVRGTTSSKLGTAILTTERLVFFDEKFSSTGTGGILDDALVHALQKRRERGGPMLDLPLASITRIAREKKLFAKDRIRISTTDDEYLFNEGWKEWSPLLLQTLSTQHGRRTIEEAPDHWLVQPT